MTTKDCFECHSPKSINHFSAKEWAKRQGICILCRRTRNARYRGKYRSSNPLALENIRRWGKGIPLR